MGSGWIIENDEGASNNQAIGSRCKTCRENPPSDTSGIATYAIDLLEGTYKLWFRIKHPFGKASDAFWFRINAGEWQKWDHIALELSNKKYFWDVNNETFSLLTGSNMLKVGIRENGGEPDMVYLTNSGSLPQELPTSVSKGEAGTIQNYRLDQNYPNPFNTSTTIRYELPITTHVDLCIYNIRGQKLSTLIKEKQNAGVHEIGWDATGFASGIYL